MRNIPQASYEAVRCADIMKRPMLLLSALAIIFFALTVRPVVANASYWQGPIFAPTLNPCMAANNGNGVNTGTLFSNLSPTGVNWEALPYIELDGGNIEQYGFFTFFMTDSQVSDSVAEFGMPAFYWFYNSLSNPSGGSYDPTLTAYVGGSMSLYVNLLNPDSASQCYYESAYAFYS
jgi:hypothetical protein